ncbi:MAG: phosphoadenosine phosphosulfate reductase family protein, partial [Parabacteroides sp.]|nr:phosphoadenosine phosphosulfate reductase family protein [Parabacteroides sp.]
MAFSKEPRPVYYKELDILGFDKYWNYTKNDTYPYMWAEANNYYYRGRLVAKTKGGSQCAPPELIILEEAEPDNLPLKYVDIPAMVEKNREILEKLAQDTIKKIYNTFVEFRDNVDVFYVAFSGGKDSIVALDLVQRALPHNEFKVLFGDTGMEFPDTYNVAKQIEEYCQLEGIEFLQSQCVYDPEYTWNQFGPPAQTMRWCCSVHKTAPQILLLREYTGNPHFRGMAFTGVRGDESASRSEYEDVSLGEKVRGQYSCHPILEWNSAELFAYIYENNLILNEAYKKGNSRAGCLVCPLAASKNMYFKEQSYSKNNDGFRTTTTFNDIILSTTAKELSSSVA